MLLFNNHTHTKNSHDSDAEISDICVNAIKTGLLGFAVSDHCDCEYHKDPAVRTGILKSFADTENAKKLYNDKLIISSGVEIGEALFAPDFADNILRSATWDLVNGSVHAVRYEKWDMPFSTIDFSDKDDKFINSYITAYFNDVYEMTVTTDFDVLCHLTVPLRYIVKKYGKKVNISLYYDMIEKILKEAIKREKTLEINTSGYSPADPFYMPDENIIDMYIQLGGSAFTLGSDAHTPEKISTGLYEASEMLKTKGVNELTYFINRKPVTYKI